MIRNYWNFPDSFDINTNHGLGMPIVESLVHQLDGTINFRSNNGLFYDIKFHEEEKEQKRWKKEA